MSKRLQVILSEDEMREIRALAGLQHMTVSEWVRQMLREARRRRPKKDAGKKISVVRASARHAFPTGDIEQILAEIEKGYS